MSLDFFITRNKEAHEIYRSILIVQRIKFPLIMPYWTCFTASYHHTFDSALAVNLTSMANASKTQKLPNTHIRIRSARSLWYFTI